MKRKPLFLMIVMFVLGFGVGPILLHDVSAEDGDVTASPVLDVVTGFPVTETMTVVPSPIVEAEETATASPTSESIPTVPGPSLTPHVKETVTNPAPLILACDNGYHWIALDPRRVLCVPNDP